MGGHIVAAWLHFKNAPARAHGGKWGATVSNFKLSVYQHLMLAINEGKCIWNELPTSDVNVKWTHIFLSVNFLPVLFLSHWGIVHPPVTAHW